MDNHNIIISAKQALQAKKQQLDEQLIKELTKLQNKAYLALQKKLKTRRVSQIIELDDGSYIFSFFNGEEEHTDFLTKEQSKELFEVLDNSYFYKLLEPLDPSYNSHYISFDSLRKAKIESGNAYFLKYLTYSSGLPITLELMPRDKDKLVSLGVEITWRAIKKWI